jgi:predicted membrane GTPase involved in stress response
MIDANEPIPSKENNGIQELMDKCNLVNLYKELHDDANEFATHVNGSQTIDFMLCTPNLVEHVYKMGYIPFYACYDSDHRGLYCDISKSIFQDSEKHAGTIKKRMVGSNSTNAEGKEYIQQLYKHLQSNNIIINKAEQLLKSIVSKIHNKDAAIKQFIN